MAPKYDILIIGSGLGGLVTGNILAKKGYKVGILEKNSYAGGCLQSFKFDNVIFDSGVHYVGGLGKGQVLDRLFSYLGVRSKFNIRMMDIDGFDRFRIGNEEYAIPIGYEKFRNQLNSYFPKEKKAIDAYSQKLKLISKSVPLYNLEPLEFDLNNFFDKFNYGNAWEYIQSITSDSRLQNLFSSANSLYAGTRESTFLFVHALISNHYIEGCYRFVDGSKQVADLLVDKLRENGGEVFFDRNAAKFNIVNKKIESVITSENEVFEAKQFISDIHPYYTFEMLEDDVIRPAYKRRIQELKNTVSAFAIYVKLEDGKVPYMNHNFYYYPSGDIWELNNYNADLFPQGFGLFPLADSVDEQYTRGFSALSFMKYEEVEKWENSSLENRGKEYNDFKELKLQKFLDLIEEAMPGIKKNICSCIASTPLTLQDYTGTYRGSIYGLLRDYQHPNESIFFPRTKVPNLYLTGQNLSLHGFMGVSISALLTCSEFTDLNNLLKEINHA